MPRVQTYGGAQVSTRPLPAARRRVVPSPDSFGASFGEVAARIGTQGLTEIFEARRERNDQLAILDAHNQLATWRQRRLEDPQTGALTVKGKDAFELHEKVAPEFETFAAGVSEKLQNDRQRLAFDRIKGEQFRALQDTLFAHEHRERETYFREQADSAITLAVSDAIANAGDPQKIAAELARGEGVIRTHLKGQADETIADKVLTFRSSVHEGIIDRLLATDQDRAARAYYEEVQDQVIGGRRAQIEKALDTGSTLAEAQRQADAILAAGGTLTQQRDKAKAIEDPEVRDRALQYIEHEQIIRDRADREQAEATLVTAYNQVEKGGLKAIPPTVWSSLPGGARASLRAYAKQLVEGTRAAVKTDYETMYALIRQSAEDPETFAKQPLLSYKHKLSDGDFEQMARLQASVISGGKKAPQILDDYRTELQVVDQVLQQSGIDPSPERKDQEGLRSKVAFLRSLVAGEARRVQGLTGKKVTNDELEAIAWKVLGTQVLDRGGWFSSDSTQPLANADIDDVPPADRRLIEQAFKRRGIAHPTDDQILFAWLEGQARK